MDDFRLDNDTSATFTLPDDGRKVGYAQYGPLNGRPVFYLHGLPGSRLEAATWEELAWKHDARMIAVERPGYGWSSPHPNRTVLDHARDVERLAEHLNLAQYLVLGGSSGGPYALACAASASEKLQGVSVVVGVGSPDMSKRGMSWTYWLGFMVAFHYFPAFTRWYFRRQPAGRLDLDDATRLELARQQFSPAGLHPRDAEWARDDEFRNKNLRHFLGSSREAFAQGFEALSQDGVLVSSDFGFRIEDIRRHLPVQLWYGSYDTCVPPVVGEQIAERLGGQARLHIVDETHSSMFANRKEEILKALLACM